MFSFFFLFPSLSFPFFFFFNAELICLRVRQRMVFPTLLMLVGFLEGKKKIIIKNIFLSFLCFFGLRCDPQAHSIQNS